MRKFNRFAKGSGCFTCRSCGKKTRDTDGGNGGVEMCPLCYEKSGCENGLSDAGYQGDAWSVFDNCKTVQEVTDLYQKEIDKLKNK